MKRKRETDLDDPESSTNDDSSSISQGYALSVEFHARVLSFLSSLGLKLVHEDVYVRRIITQAILGMPRA